MAATFARKNVVEIDTTGSTGTITFTQTGGTAATITGPTNSIYRIVLPDTFTAELTFALTTTLSGVTDTKQITVSPPSTARDLTLVLKANGVWASPIVSTTTTTPVSPVSAPSQMSAPTIVEA